MKNIFVIISICLTVLFTPHAFASTVDLRVDNESIKTNVEPYIVEGRVMVPLGVVSESLGLDVFWNSKSRIAIITSDKMIAEFEIGENTVRVNGKSMKLDAPSEIKNGRVMVPLSTVAGLFGYTAKWNNEEKAAEIFTDIQSNTFNLTPAPKPEEKTIILTNIYSHNYFHYMENGQEKVATLVCVEKKNPLSSQAIKDLKKEFIGKEMNLVFDANFGTVTYYAYLDGKMLNRYYTELGITVPTEHTKSGRHYDYIMAALNEQQIEELKESWKNRWSY